MGSAQHMAAPRSASDSRTSSQVNISPLSASRVCLEVVFTGITPDTSRESLATLLRSPLGVYVTQTEVLWESASMRVCFDIAPEDLDFTLHMLQKTLPDAEVGTMTQLPAQEVC
jgi:hypothetical protein